MDKYQNLIDKEKYQVFLFVSRANFPFLFAVHPWFVLNKKGDLSRWEVIYSKKLKSEKSWGHLYRNLFPLFQGLNTFTFLKKPINKTKMVGMIEGEIAQNMIDFIEEIPKNYRYLDKYRIWGPNSNTFAEYVIKHFSESGFCLPRNAFGKNYEE